MIPQGRFWGALIAAAGIALGFLCIVWTLTSAGSTGGKILGLSIVVILALPLVFGGAYLFMQGSKEKEREQFIVSKQKALEVETLSRTQIAEIIELQRDRIKKILQLEESTLDPTSRLMLEDITVRLEGASRVLQRSAYDRLASPESLLGSPGSDIAVQSVDSALQGLVEKLENSVSKLTGDLSNQSSRTSSISELASITDNLEDAINRRYALVAGTHSRALPTVAELLSDVAPVGATNLSDFTSLSPGDAVTYEEKDYLISARLEWRDRDKIWWTYMLSSKDDTWLYVADGGTRIGIMHRVTGTVIPEGNSFTSEGKSYRAAIDGTALVEVTGASGSRGGLIVTYRRYDSSEGFLWIETWQDENKIFSGRWERPENISVWKRRSEDRKE